MHICYNCTFLYSGTAVPIQPGAWVNLYIYICVYVCMYVYMHAYMLQLYLSLSRHGGTYPAGGLGEFIHIYMCVCMHVGVHACIYVTTLIFLYPGTGVPIQPGAWVNLYIYMCVYVCM